MSSVILSPLDSWQETKSFPLVSSKRIQELVSSPQLSPSQKLHPIPKKKSSFLVDHKLLQSLAPLLHNAECQSFCDRYFDNKSNDLLLNDGVWLCYRSFFSEEPIEPVLKLRTSVRTSETEKTIQWAEFQGEAEIVELLRLAGTIPPGETSKLISLFGFPYLHIKTKRYFLRRNKIWVDFFGWADSPQEGASRGIFAICSVADDLPTSELPEQLVPYKNDETNKTLLMLYHLKGSLFDKVGGFGKNLASIPLGFPFDDYDKYLGLMETFRQSIEVD